MVQQESELSWIIIFCIRIHCIEECSGDDRVVALQDAHDWSYNWWSNEYLLRQRSDLCENNATQVDTVQEASYYCLPLRPRSGRGCNGQSVEVAYIDKLGRLICQKYSSTKYRGSTGQIYILRGELEYVVFKSKWGFTTWNWPTLIVKSQTRVPECTDMAYFQRDPINIADNGSQVPCGISGHNLMEWLSLLTIVY